MINDVFLSYAREDREWALKLHRDLSDRGLSVFLDERIIKAGQDWRKKLTDELLESRDLVVLWSDHAAASDWVKDEAAMFIGFIANDAREGKKNGRKFLQVWLKGQWDQHGNLQAIEDLQKSPLYNYENGAAAVDAGLWETIVTRLLDAMDWGAGVPVLWQVVMAATRKEMEAVDLDDVPEAEAASLNQLLKHLNMTRDQLLERYGERRDECRPFAGGKTVLAILAEMRNQILELGGPLFRWRPVGELFWTTNDNTQLAKFAYALRNEPCVVVIDAFSLYDKTVRSRCRRIARVIENPCAALMVVPPFGVAQREYLRRSLGELIQEIHTQVHFLSFGLTELPKANCDLLIPDDYEMRRLLAATLFQSRGKHWATHLGGGL